MKKLTVVLILVMFSMTSCLSDKYVKVLDTEDGMISTIRDNQLSTNIGDTLVIYKKIDRKVKTYSHVRTGYRLYGRYIGVLPVNDSISFRKVIRINNIF